MGDGVRVVVFIEARPDAAEAMKSIALTLADQSRKETGCVSGLPAVLGMALLRMQGQFTSPGEAFR